ncbi:MAG TPA: glycosyltransferase [Longimicrobiales bacterium]
MRVLVVGKSRPHDIAQRVRHTIARQGHETALVNNHRVYFALGSAATGAWLGARYAAFRPDRVILNKAIGIPPGLVRRMAARTPTVMWYRDLRIPPDPAIVARAREVDTLFLTAGGQVTDFEALGVRRVLYLPDGADAERDQPGEPAPEFDCDVAYLGSGDPYRAEFLAEVGKRYRLRTFGTGWEKWADQVSWQRRSVTGEDFGRACASARIVLSVERAFQADTQVASYTSNRIFRVIAAGGFYLGLGSAGARALLRDGEHCAYYESRDHALALIERYLGDASARECIRATGRAFVLAHHTLAHRVHNLMTGEPFTNPLDALRTA